jgi:plastocyanin
LDFHVRGASAIASAIVMSVVSAAACSPAPAPAAPPAAAKRVDAATAGSVNGRITFAGAVPKPELLSMGGDAACVEGAVPNPVSDRVLIGADGGLANVVVYIKSSFDGYAFDTPSAAVTMDQKGCVYRPRVFGVRVGQPIEILNSDATVHNVHALPMQNQEFNESQPRARMRTTKVFTVPEVMVRFKCDFHGWMAAHVGVMSHPFFAVTDATGAFSLSGLPPGSYTLEAWHESFGTLTQQVTIAPSGKETVAMTFAAK